MATVRAAAMIILGLLLCVYVSIVAAEGKKTGSSETIGCFTCHSYNDSDPGCQDPFSPGLSIYTPKCKAGVKDRFGSFPAHYCIKMSGRAVEGDVELTVRTCALKSMYHHCGFFMFERTEYRGCLTTCERNGCNHGNHVTRPPLPAFLILCLAALVSSRLEFKVLRS